MYPPQSPTRMTNNSILKLEGASHWVKTSRMRFWAFSYSIGEPCGRSFQVIMYFVDMGVLPSDWSLVSTLMDPSAVVDRLGQKAVFGDRQRRLVLGRRGGPLDHAPERRDLFCDGLGELRTHLFQEGPVLRLGLGDADLDARASVRAVDERVAHEHLRRARHGEA